MAKKKMSGEPINATHNLNTILLYVAIAMMGWTGYQTYTTSVDVARLMPRQEIELKLAQVELNINNARISIEELKARMIALEVLQHAQEHRQAVT